MAFAEAGNTMFQIRINLNFGKQCIGGNIDCLFQDCLSLSCVFFIERFYFIYTNILGQTGFGLPKYNHHYHFPKGTEGSEEVLQEKEEVEKELVEVRLELKLGLINHQ